jgi:NAD dependent epimerase/dehydratase family enzyme
MLPAFRTGLGGPQGSGRQYVSWVSLEDELGAIEHALFDEGVVGALNGVGPAPVTNEELAQTLGRVLKRPARTRVPETALKLLFGETAEAALLASQRAMPGALLATGFRFQHAELEAALRFTLGR